MRILILGGTGFIGPHIVDSALKQKHTLTLFNRGKTNPGLFPDIEKLHGDRDTGDLKSLEGKHWDAAIDTHGFVPRKVREVLDVIAPNIGQYVFISTISVYPGDAKAPIDETTPVGKIDDPTVEKIDGQTYGPLKALCEQAAEAKMPGHVTNLRPHLIVGPGDTTDRYTYWPARVDRGGEVLCPGDGSDPIQYIDARDLADLCVKVVEDGHAGTFNVVGPKNALTIRELVDGCKCASGSDATFAWCDETFLGEQAVSAWSDMPVWTSRAGLAMATVKNERAISIGLKLRTPAETIRDTLEWHRTRGADYKLKAGIAPEREAKVLAAWHAREKK
jgi:2'-hydroxyisoflavone reductase